MNVPLLLPYPSFFIIHPTDCSDFFFPKIDNPSVLYLTGDRDIVPMLMVEYYPCPRVSLPVVLGLLVAIVKTIIGTGTANLSPLSLGFVSSVYRNQIDNWILVYKANYAYFFVD